MEDVIRNYAKYIKTVNEESIEANFVLKNSLTKIIDDVFSGKNKTDYNKDINFIINLFKSVEILNKKRLINFQGQPLFNRSIQIFLQNSHKDNDAIIFFQESIRNDPSLIYKFSTTTDSINHVYESIDSSKNFSGNFICNFPGAINKDGEISYGEGRCQPNILSEILFALNYNKIPEDNKADIVVQLLCSTLDSLCAHTESLKQSNNSEELQKINYLLNCPIKDPITMEFFTPMDLINKVVESEKEILKQRQEDLLSYVKQLRVEPVCLQTMVEVSNSIEFKKAVAKKQKEAKSREKPIDLNADGYMERIFLSKEEKEEQKRLRNQVESIPLNEHRAMEKIFTPEVLATEKRDVEETKRGNKEIKKLQEELSIAEKKAKRTMAYRFFNTLSKFFLRRETKYKTEQQKLAEKKLNEKMVELSKPFFTSASKVTDQQMKDLKLSKQQERLATLNYDRNKSTVDIRTVS